MGFMLDLHFKNLQLIRDYVGLELAIQVVVNFDREILMPLLLTIYHALTPNSAIVTSVASTVVELGVFGSLAFTKKVAMGLITIELLLFRRTAMPIDLFSPFIWWAKHEQQFSNLTYLAQQVMGIVGSQIETKRIFNMVGVITSLKRCQLGIENLDKLVTIMKNWPNDPKFECTSGPKSFE
jgi:hypothetical protein